MNYKDFAKGLKIGLVGIFPYPYVEPPVSGDVLDNEWPIEWSQSAVEGNSANITMDGGTIYYISNLQIAPVNVRTMVLETTVGGNIVQLPYYDPGAEIDNESVSFVMLSDEVNTAMLFCATADGAVFDGVTFPKAGLYIMYDFVPDDGNFKLTANMEQRKIFTITADSVTEDSVVWDSDLPMLKFTDSILTAEDIRASGIKLVNADGENETYDTIGEYIDAQANENVYISEIEGGCGFVVAFPLLVSVNDYTAFSATPKFQENGTYVLIPGAGASITVKLAGVS